MSVQPGKNCESSAENTLELRREYYNDRRNVLSGVGRMRRVQRLRGNWLSESTKLPVCFMSVSSDLTLSCGLVTTSSGRDEGHL